LFAAWTSEPHVRLHLPAQARKDVAYELYLGTTNPTEQATKALYTTSSADAVYGWQSQDCTALAQFMCDVPPSAFPCNPPPSPPAPPPLPPSPPSPPLSAICGWLDPISCNEWRWGC
jgi:hypothetical protein